MSISSSVPWPITRSRWFEPLVTAMVALILGLAFTNLGSSTHLLGQVRHKSSNASSTETPQGRDIRSLVGQLDKKPQRTATIPPPHLAKSGTWYMIQWGDTLSQISVQYHVSIAALEAQNHLAGSLIQAGQRLFIPGATRTTATAEAATPESSQGQLAPEPLGLNSADIVMLAHLVQGEAGNQPYLGQVAVAAVVLNRLRAPGFPKTLEGVIFEENQFDSVTDGSYYAVPSAQALMAAQAAARGWDPTHGALYFFNPSLPHAAWMDTLAPDVLIGQQEFCR